MVNFVWFERRNMKFNQQKIGITIWCFFVLCLFYWCSYLLQIIGKNFSITLFAYRCFGISMLASIVFFLVLLPQKLSLFISWILIGISLMMLVVDIFCYFVFTSTLSQSMLSTIIETNFAEIKSFMKLYFSLGLCATIAIVLCCGLFATKKIKRLSFCYENVIVKIFPFYIFYL